MNNSNNCYYNYYIIAILNRFQLSLKPKSIQWVVTPKQLNLVQNLLTVVVVPTFVVIDSIGYFWLSKVSLAKLEKVEI